MLRKVEHQVQGYRTHDGAGVSLVRVIGLKTVEIFDPFFPAKKQVQTSDP